jgi:external thioesterase TEII
MPYLKEYNVYPLELPGRGRRMNEPLITNREEAVDDLFQQLLKRNVQNDFLLYGHSMGASLGLDILQKLEKAKHFPLAFIVSGNEGPRNLEIPTNRYRLPRSEFIEELKRLGGVSDELLNHSELFDFFEPIMRADFELVERVQSPVISPIETPILAIMGTKEEGAAHIRNWGNYTKGQFQHHLLEGDHFFIRQHPARIADLISKLMYWNLRV